ncbi:hypothetical protein QW71_16665 [Paenibacillus sp. IHB B 3415]|nr:hypothetical protein QW71_16665 [Paenibacillus sp. IHB B 3415]
MKNTLLGSLYLSLAASLKEKITFKKAFSIILATIGFGIIVGNAGIDPSLQLGGISLLVAALSWGGYYSGSRLACPFGQGLL